MGREKRSDSRDLPPYMSRCDVARARRYGGSARGLSSGQSHDGLDEMKVHVSWHLKLLPGMCLVEEMDSAAAETNHTTVPEYRRSRLANTSWAAHKVCIPHCWRRNLRRETRRSSVVLPGRQHAIREAITNIKSQVNIGPGGGQLVAFHSLVVAKTTAEAEPPHRARSRTHIRSEGYMYTPRYFEVLGSATA